MKRFLDHIVLLTLRPKHHRVLAHLMGLCLDHLTVDPVIQHVLDEPAGLDEMSAGHARARHAVPKAVHHHVVHLDLLTVELGAETDRIGHGLDGEILGMKGTAS